MAKTNTHALSIGILVLLALARRSVALAYRTTEHMVNFDDIPHEINVTNSIALYSGLYWSEFTHYLPSVAPGARHGIPASSPPCHALSHSNLHNLFSLPTTHTALEFTGNVFFDLHAFNWGCLAINTTTHIPLRPETPTNCSLRLQCYHPGGLISAASGVTSSRPQERPSASGLYFFTVSSAMRIWGVQMANVDLGGEFRACQSITWEVRALAVGGTREVSLALDDVRYRTYRITAWDWKGLGEIIHENGPYGIA